MRRIIVGLAAAGGLALLATGWGLHAADPPAGGAPPRSGVDRSQGDRQARPQDDLFRAINGAWLDGAEIPADRSLDGAFYALRDRAEADIRAIVEEAAGSGGAGGSGAKKVGDLYASFVDEAAADRLGVGPIREELARVDAIEDRAALVVALAEFRRAGIDGAFELFVDTDAKQSDRYIVSLMQGGLGLPDESYYREAKFRPILDAYAVHVGKMLALAGWPAPEAAAKAVVALETKLAQGHWDRVKSRDDTLTYNKMDLPALGKVAPGFDWPAWFKALGAAGVGEVVVRQPSYFEAMSKAMEEVPLDSWKAWLAWNVVRARAPLLDRGFVEQDFDFSGRTLTGAKELRPRWKRGVAAVEWALGHAAGELYTAKHFPPEAKARMGELVTNLIEAYRRNIVGLDWMGEATKAKALEKLGQFTPKIGYPDRWRDYSALEIRRDDLVGNIRRASAFELDRNLNKLGKPVDRGEWQMTPQTVNAYYNPGMNEIVFPAAILKPPFFDPGADDAVNYGAIGAVIGHEIGHGFDDQGSKYDGLGNLNDWWTDADRKEFEARTAKLIAQYEGFEPAQLPGRHVNGALTIGENIGDLGGLTIAHKAYRIARGDAPSPTLDGLTGDQRFFAGWAQVWRAKYRDAELSRRLAVDPHSPAEFRCNGVVRNMPEFYEAFGVKQGDKLWLPADARVRIW